MVFKTAWELTLMRLLVFGSKEYPLGTSDDSIKSGGIEKDAQELARHIAPHLDGVVIVTRRFRKTRPYERDGNIEVFRVPWIRGFYFRALSFNLFALLRALLIRDYDAVLSYALFPTMFGWIVSRLRRKKHIAIPTGITHTQPQYIWPVRVALLLLEKVVYRLPDVTVFLSEQNMEQFGKELGFLPKRYYVIPHAVEHKKASKEETMSFRRRSGLGKESVIAFIGRLIAVKGVDVLIDAVAGMKGNFRLVVVGDGPERERLAGEAKRRGLENRIVFTGWLDDVSPVLESADVFVLPSHSEGLPLSLLEAMAAGKACIVTDIGLPVENGRDALVVPPGDAESLRSALGLLLKNKGLRERLGRNARERIKRDFSWSKTIEGYLALLREVQAREMQ